MGKPSTVETGDVFEREVADLLSYLPDASVTPHERLGGKDVDIVLRLDGGISGKTVIAIDTKAYARPLTRKAVNNEIVEYSNVLRDGHADKFYLVTKNGIVANARSVLNFKDTFHFTITELHDLVVRPRVLIQNMELSFTINAIDQYYVPAKSYKYDLHKLCANFDKCYHALVDYALSLPHQNADKILQAAPQQLKDSLPISSSELTKFIALRNPSETSDLESQVDAWLNDPTISEGLAIIGSYGTGKSTFARRIASLYADRYKNGVSSRIPFLIELREFGSHQSVEGLITHHLVNRHKLNNGSYELFQQMNRDGRYIIIFDGFDEMKQGLTQDALVFNFNQISSLREGKAKILLLGRPTVFVSGEERSAILSGGTLNQIPSKGRFIQLTIAPLNIDDVFRLLNGYVAARKTELKAALSARISELKAALPRNSELRDLLTRPVHLPMLVEILPTLQGPIAKLRRASLYRQFISRIISREVERLGREYQNRYSVQQRYEFACDLATAMFVQGGAPAIRYAEIPQDVARPYLRPGETLDMAQRDLLAACFLDVKHPDIFHFQHKSFLEFLVAENIAKEVQGNDPDTRRFGRIFTPEVITFFRELYAGLSLTRVLANMERNEEFMIAFIAAIFDNFTIYLIDIQLIRATQQARGKIPKFGLVMAAHPDSAAFVAEIFDHAVLTRVINGQTSINFKRRYAVYFVLVIASHLKKVSESLDSLVSLAKTDFADLKIAAITVGMEQGDPDFAKRFSERVGTKEIGRYKKRVATTKAFSPFWDVADILRTGSGIAS